MDSAHNDILTATFTEAVQSVFRTMLRQTATGGTGSNDPSASKERLIRSSISLCGGIPGSMTLVMRESVALAALKAMTGGVVGVGTQQFCDAMGELANMIAGHAAPRVPGRRFAICCPKTLVVSGEEKGVGAKTADGAADGSCLKIPFSAAIGAFTLEIRLAGLGGEAKAA
ncbi:MAG: chemotaxis protein CheX [Phycisphaerales bacterium]